MSSDPLFILVGFECGVDAVLLAGCHLVDCNYSVGNYHHRTKASLYSRLFAFLGIDGKRLKFSWVSASEAKKWQGLINEFTNEVRQLGPFTRYQEINLDLHGKSMEEKEEALARG